jgi:hypothetical protein
MENGGTERRRWARLAVLVGVGLTSACAFVGGDPDSAAAGGSAEGDGLVPAGYGTLRQNEVSLGLRRADLLIRATPLAESVIRLTAPDTYGRLRGLKEDHRASLVRRSGIDDPVVFLVSFFSYEPDITFEPEDVHLVNRGLRYRPLGIQPVTPGWGAQRLAQEETQMALYAFDPGLDLAQDLAVQYQDVRQAGWERILQRIQAERARARARAQSDG